jgi:Tfp pilus assembly protein PilF
MFCRNCGMKLEDGASFCGNCGTKIEIRESNAEVSEAFADVSPQRDSKKRKKKGLIISLIAIICILILAGGFITYNKHFSPEAQYDKYMGLGHEHLREEDYEQAIIEFEKAIQIEDRRLAAYIGLADAFIGNDEMEKAEETFYKILDIDVAFPNAYLQLADIYIENEELEEAFAILEKGYAQTSSEDIQNKIDWLQEEMEPDIVPFEVEKLIDFAVEIPGESDEDLGYEILFSIPKVKDTVPNGDKINNKLKDYWEIYEDAYQGFKNNDFSLMEEYGLCIWTAKFDVHQYQSYCALVINEYSGAPYSGGVVNNIVFFYDVELGDIISASEYATNCGYSVTQVLSKYNEQDFEPPSSIDMAPFYVDSNGELNVLLNGAF